MTCTWRHCTALAAEAFIDARGRRWACLCRSHAQQLELATRIDSTTWSASRLVVLSVLARGGWWATVKGWFLWR